MLFQFDSGVCPKETHPSFAVTPKSLPSCRITLVYIYLYLFILLIIFSAEKAQRNGNSFMDMLSNSRVLAFTD